MRTPQNVYLLSSTAASSAGGTDPSDPPSPAELLNSNELLRATIEVLEERVQRAEMDKRILEVLEDAVKKLEQDKRILREEATLKLRRIQELDRRIEDLERENERLSQHLQWFTAARCGALVEAFDL